MRAAEPARRPARCRAPAPAPARRATLTGGSGDAGYFPSLKGKFPHPVPLNLWDPFGFTAKMTPERKEKALLAEINNGRLAQIGIFGLISASKGLIVPGLDQLGIPPYAGEVMAPFTRADAASLPVVEEMLKWAPPYAGVTL